MPSDRLTPAKALELYQHASIHDLGSMAHAMAQRLHPEPYRTYVVDRNINYSNVCMAGCAFCNFKVDLHDPEAYVLQADTILAKIRELLDIGGTQVLMQGGLHPTLPLEWYEDLLRTIKSHYPAIHMHAFSPPEIDHFAARFSMSVGAVLGRLRAAGLDSLPGGGAEILVDRVRRRISPGKCDTAAWLEVMRQSHRLGMVTSATMMFGSIETDEERIEHLVRLRELQDETGGFIAFIPWTFQHENAPLAKGKDDPRITQISQMKDTESKSAPSAESADELDGSGLRLAGAYDYLRMLAVSRLFLDNIPNVQASWVTQGAKIGQLALFYGANDLGSVMMEENVVSAAGTTYRLDEAAIRHLIRSAGWVPRQRNQRYELIEETGMAARAERAGHSAG